MAKWGEGDPRWLVEERPDATNVNNWHWSEKNATMWSQNKFSELFVGMKYETPSGNFEILKMKKCQGEAYINNRKAKLTFFYDWNLEFEWKKTFFKDDIVIEGTIQILDFSDEKEIEDLEIKVSANTSNYASDLMRNSLAGILWEFPIKEKLSRYITSLKEEFSKSILPCKDPLVSETTTRINMSSAPTDPGLMYNKDKELKQDSELTNFEIIENFKCTAEDFFKAMITEELIKMYTQSKCVVEPKVYGKFVLFDGNIQGYFTELEPFKKIVQKWKLKTWPEDHYSDVYIYISELSDSTEVVVKQNGVPAKDLQYTREGWQTIYFKNMKAKLGFGSFLT